MYMGICHYKGKVFEHFWLSSTLCNRSFTWYKTTMLECKGRTGTRQKWCHFHHWVYYELTKALSPVGLISLKWIEYCIQYHKGQGSIPGQTWIFSSSFSTAYVTQLQESFPLSILVTLYNNSEHFLSQILGCQGKTNWILPWGFF